MWAVEMALMSVEKKVGMKVEMRAAQLDFEKELRSADLSVALTAARSVVNWAGRSARNWVDH